ncbi:MAG: Zn-ribbon containing protein [Candidatus Micrarchaeota archaeon]
MPHRCVRCNKLYGDEDVESLNKGCECGAKVFVFTNEQADLEGVEDIAWIEEELAGIVQKTHKVVSLDVENVKVIKRGIFEIDVGSLAKNPVVVKDTEGVYYLRLPKPKRN